MKTINKGLRQPVITALLSLSLLLLPSCLKGELDELEIWKAENDKWLETTDFSDYEKVAPSWAPQNFIYIKWHNDRKLTEKNLVPMSTSTVNTKYEILFDYTKKTGIYTMSASPKTAIPFSRHFSFMICLSCFLLFPSGTFLQNS